MLVYKGFHVNFAGSPNNPSITMDGKSLTFLVHLHTENYKQILIPNKMGPISLYRELGHWFQDGIPRGFVEKNI